MSDVAISVLVVIGLMLGSLLIPAEFDPAIRLKEWLAKRRGL